MLPKVLTIGERRQYWWWLWYFYSGRSSHSPLFLNGSACLAWSKVWIRASLVTLNSNLIKLLEPFWPILTPKSTHIIYLCRCSFTQLANQNAHRCTFASALYTFGLRLVCGTGWSLEAQFQHSPGQPTHTDQIERFGRLITLPHSVFDNLLLDFCQVSFQKHRKMLLVTHETFNYLSVSNVIYFRKCVFDVSGHVDGEANWHAVPFTFICIQVYIYQVQTYL